MLGALGGRAVEMSGTQEDSDEETFLGRSTLFRTASGVFVAASDPENRTFGGASKVWGTFPYIETFDNFLL